MELRTRAAGGLGVAIMVLLGPLVAGCGAGETEEHPAPSAAQIAGYYEYEGDLSVEMSGNVAQVEAVISREEFRRGGDVWAKASPYIFIFSPGTRQAMRDHPGLGGVRVIIRYEDGTMLAQALLSREALTRVSWQQVLQAAQAAREEGTERPGMMRDLIRWGEDHTDFEYNPDYISVP